MVDKSANGLNRHRANKNNRRSQTAGVSWCAKAGKWRVRVKVRGQEIWGGYFTDEREAAKRSVSLRRETAGISIRNEA